MRGDEALITALIDVERIAMKTFCALLLLLSWCVLFGFEHAAAQQSSDTNGLTDSSRILSTPMTYGNYNTAVGCSFVANSNHPAQVMGWSNPSGVAAYFTRDSVGCYFDNSAPPPIAFVLGTYTETTFAPSIPLPSLQLSQLRVGMLINSCSSSKSPCPDVNFFTGTITSWTSRTIAVSGWFQQGSTAIGQNPSLSYCKNGSTCYAVLNPVTKLWGINANLLLDRSSYATYTTGFELGLVDNSTTASTNSSWGFDSVNLTSHQGNSAYIARGPWAYQYHCVGGAERQPNPGIACLMSTQTAGSIIQNTEAMTSGNYLKFLNFTVDYSGRIDTGSETAVSSAGVIAFHSSGHTGSDAEITVTGGSGENNGFLVGQSTLTCLSANTLCGSEALRVVGVRSQVNQVVVTGAAAGSPPAIQASGADGSINLKLAARGAGQIKFDSVMNLSGYTVSTLPPCNATYNGGMAYVTDFSGTPVYNGVLTGGGMTTVPVFCNGSKWTAH
jgi:hypothetical protein